MNRVRLRPSRAKEPAPSVSREQIRRQIGQAAGTENFQNRDPLHHITESFQMTFDAMGQRHAAQLTRQEAQPEQTGAEPGQEAAKAGDMPDKTSARSFYQCSNPEDQQLLKRFSEISFQRGTLSGAVIRGTGQMMLFSCLKKTVGQNQPDKWQQRKLFETASPHRNVSHTGKSKVVFNRGFTDSAIGLVVDTLRDARRSVEDMQALATGSGSESGMAGGAQTLRRMYPFLDDTREQSLLEEYRRQLETMEEGDPKRSILHNAMNQTNALIQKKAQMKLEFINKLRFVSDRATEALEAFRQPGFAAQIHEALVRELSDEDPPKQGGNDDGTAGAAGAAENGTGAGEEA